MTREEAIKKLKVAHLGLPLEVKDACEMAIKALGLSNPCDLCGYAPASSADGKPCTMCPATRAMTVDESVDESKGSVYERVDERVDDCISRQAVLDINENHHGQMPNHVNHQIWEEIKALPSVTPAEKVGRWIPVSERLPEVHKDVLIYLSSNEICIGFYNSHRLPFSNNVIGWGASYAHGWCSNDVIAWMPLPKPYEPQESEKKLSWLGKSCKDCGNEKCKKLGTLPKGYDCALWQSESEDKE